MKRSAGATVVAVALVALLAACGTQGPDPTATSGPSELATDEPVVARSCPDGFADALAAHIAAATGDTTRVLADDAYRFEPSSVDRMLDSGCVVRVEQDVPGGVMIRALGVATEVGFEDAVAVLIEEGWVQPFPEVEPWAYESEERNPAGNADMVSMGVFPAAGVDPIFSFPDWSQYFPESAVAFQAAYGF
jgi:hypothetical protein